MAFSLRLRRFLSSLGSRLSWGCLLLIEETSHVANTLGSALEQLLTCQAENRRRDLLLDCGYPCRSCLTDLLSTLLLLIRILLLEQVGLQGLLLLFDRLCDGCICGFLVGHLGNRRLLLLTFVHGDELAAASHTGIVLKGRIGLLSESGLVLHVERNVARQKVLADPKALINDALCRLELR